VTQSAVPVPVVYQDCNVVVLLVTKVGGQARTKHLWARVNQGKEMMEEARVKAIHTKAGNMQADGFTKLYDPTKHEPLARIILGKGKQGR
jgi:hypothetical protein